MAAKSKTTLTDIRYEYVRNIYTTNIFLNSFVKAVSIFAPSDVNFNYEILRSNEKEYVIRLQLIPLIWRWIFVDD